MWCLLFGSAFFFMPGIGLLLAAGFRLSGGLFGRRKTRRWLGGLVAPGAGLCSIGIPKNRIIDYEKQIKAGNFVVITHGTPDDVSRAKSTLAVIGHQGLQEHMASA